MFSKNHTLHYHGLENERKALKNSFLNQAVNTFTSYRRQVGSVSKTEGRLEVYQRQCNYWTCILHFMYVTYTLSPCNLGRHAGCMHSVVYYCSPLCWQESARVHADALLSLWIPPTIYISHFATPHKQPDQAGVFPT